MLGGKNRLVHGGEGGGGITFKHRANATKESLTSVHNGWWLNRKSGDACDMKVTMPRKEDDL